MTPNPEEDPVDATSADDADASDTEAASPDKPDFAKRFMAQLIDGVLAMAMFWLCTALIPGWYAGYVLGILAAGGFFLIRDGLGVAFMNRRSVGKKVMKLRPVRLDGTPMDLTTSIQRNWMFSAGWLASLPFLGVLGTLIGMGTLIIILYECYKVLTDADSRRWGDELAGTKVIESAD